MKTVMAIHSLEAASELLLDANSSRSRGEVHLDFAHALQLGRHSSSKL